MAYLTVQTPVQTRHFAIRGTLISIGRSAENTLCLMEDTRLSRRHCLIERTAEGGLVLRDLDSSNGTFMDGVRIAEVPLLPGKSFLIGNTRIQYHAQLPPELAAQAAAGPARPQPPAAYRATPAAAETPRSTSARPKPGPPRVPPETARAPVAPPASRTAAFSSSFPPAPPSLPPHAPPWDAAPPAPTPAQESDAALPEPDALPPPLAEPPARPREPDPLERALDDSEDHALRRGPTLVSGKLMHLTQLGRDPGFSDAHIALINARGEVVHDAGSVSNRQSGTGIAADALVYLRLVLYGCMRSAATDIHIEPKREEYTLRYRIDGAMVEVLRIEHAVGHRLLRLVKIVSDIDITGRDIMQEGHFSTRLPMRRVDYRVSFTPSMYGQKLVIRALDPLHAPQRLGDLHLSEWMHRSIRDVARRDSGVLLVCGPTGSGKTTTLYTVLREIDLQMRNVLTIEDPIEYEIDGVTQIPVNEDQGHSFHQLLRSCLRQDPDVIVLGEIRDRDTAITAMQAASTGHLVLSTLHAQDSISTIFRLLDLGVEPYLLASTLNLILAQRLARVLCRHCKEPRRPTPGQVVKLGRAQEGLKQIYYPVGCEHCFQTGYAGRRGLFELLVAHDQLRSLITRQPDLAAFKASLKGHIFTSLLENGCRLVVAGETSLDEIDRITSGF